MESILLPSRIEYTPGERPNEAKLIVEPCYYGYGTTLGNALRRILLSSLPGSAVTAVNIKGALHEFSTVPNVKEDILEIILNLKKLRLKSYSDLPVKLRLYAKGEKKITAKDFEKNADVEIGNKDLHIASLTDKKAEFEMEVTVENGRGYVPAEARDGRPQEIGTIMIDALFSPIKNVGYKVENARVGEITNYDRLILTIETDGTITPEEAVQGASRLLIDNLSLLAKGSQSLSLETEPAAEETAVLPEEIPQEVEVEPEEALSEEGTGELQEESAPEEKPKKKRGRPKKKAS